MSIQHRSNIALEKIRAGEVVHVYVMGNFASPRHVDFVGQSGCFDALWFDLEHFDIPTAELSTLNLVAQAWPVATFARIYIGDYQTAARILETGVAGIMCPMVETAEQARAIVGWTKFNNPSPQGGETIGLRGWNGGGIDARYGAFPALDYIAHQNRETVLLAQIETPSALENCESIAHVAGIDALFFGPGDYAHRIGKPGQLGDAEVGSAMKRVADAAAAAGKWWGTVAPTRELYLQAKAWGARFISPGGDVKVMTLGLRQLAQTITGASDEAKSSSAGSAPKVDS
ncbi:HpcH/HpaI aldolase family protein [Synoicihabitans lomoniglobus]|uniref:Aldolase/citrate lyase family protein n=1 Tax=Synoicihabitans lomoniglobus TaxID=2909285 RepID=A0AAF0CPJ4_9BACT|nr:aldolase/citrate lyase family protein [Opitutaceae bacterium LMO-M01]WED65059.1 aldolase/citrate lyase family protein [Opitutaceae bacterium LMO-M01]